MGNTQQLHATALYSDGTQKDLTTTASWSSENANVAAVNASGLVTAASVGTTTLKAASSGLSGTASISVSSSKGVKKNLVSIAISPSEFSLFVGQTQQLKATGTFDDESTSDLTRTVTWASSDPKSATIDSNGLFSGLHAGAVTVTATSGDISGTASVIINNRVAKGTADVLTWHADNFRAGLNSAESTLTTSNVTPSTFGKLFSYLVDGYIYATPLYVSNLTINRAQHNVVFVATENDSVYAFDADIPGNGTPLWKKSLLGPEETPLTGSIKPTIGITATPVIDKSSSTMYVVSEQNTAMGGTFRLHALDLLTGNEKFGGPVDIHASVPSTAPDAVNGQLTLTTSCLSRAALLLTQGTIVIGIGSCPHGWLLAYDAVTLRQNAVLNLGPDATGFGHFASVAGVWGSGGGPAADEQGNIYVATENGPWDGQSAWGDSVLKLNAQLQVIDYFTPESQKFLDCRDEDLGAAAAVLLPGTGALIAGGKNGKLFLLNQSNLGHLQASDAGALDSMWYNAAGTYSQPCAYWNGLVLNDTATSYQLFGSAAWFNGSFYLAADNGAMRQFVVSGGHLQTGSASQNIFALNSTGATPFISSNGNANGIVWAIDHGVPLQKSGTPTPAVVHAYDASDLSRELYNSAQNPSDTAGLAIKFTSPIVANGKVFIGTGHDPLSVPNPQGELDVYGLR